MEVRAISTGTVQIKTAMERGRGPLPTRIARTLLDRSYTRELPIHAWLIEHPEGPILIDTGELSSSSDLPFARFHVQPEQEIDRQLAALGVEPADLAQVVLTHLHGDHMNGLKRLAGARVRASAAALRGRGRTLRKLGAQATPIELSGPPVGGFAGSAQITSDGRVLAVPTPGHAPGHISVLLLEQDHHVLLAGDAAYTQQQLLDRQPDGVSLSARLAARSMTSIIEHARRHPTVVLPSHDPGSEARLRERTALAV